MGNLIDHAKDVTGFGNWGSGFIGKWGSDFIGNWGSVNLGKFFPSVLSVLAC